MDLENATLAELAGASFPCSCGKQHSVGIRKIVLGSGVLGQTGALLAELGAKRVFLLADVNTYKAAGETLPAQLEAAGIGVHCHILGDHLVPDEACVGGALLHLQGEDDFILAVGSGTINDTARLLSTRLHLPYAIVCTAPSMDGYASTVSPMIIGGQKITLTGVYPLAIIADTAVLKNAPLEMLRSGYGDILGKYTALADWALAKEETGEYDCTESIALMRRALQRCTDHAAGLERRDETAVQYVTEGLILAGIAMGLVGNSRPASGAEHHFAHFWEVALLGAGKPHPLHGNCVGAATVVVAALYALCPELAHLAPPAPEKVKAALDLAGCAVNPAVLGIEKALFHESVLHAMEIRERYTILRYLSAKNKLPAYADLLTEKYYK